MPPAYGQAISCSATKKIAKVFETVAEGGVIHLPGDVPATAHCLVTVLDDDLESLRQQSRFTLPAAKQQRMGELLQKHGDGVLGAGEVEEFDALSAEFDAATLAKGRALAALAQLSGNPARG